MTERIQHEISPELRARIDADQKRARERLAQHDCGDDECTPETSKGGCPLASGSERVTPDEAMHAATTVFDEPVAVDARIALLGEAIAAYVASRPEEERARVTIERSLGGGGFNVSAGIGPMRSWLYVRDESSGTETDAALAWLRAELAKPPASKPQPRTEAIKAHCDGKTGVTIEGMDDPADPLGHLVVIGGKAVEAWHESLDGNHPPEKSAEAICARIDAALAKAEPARSALILDVACVECGKAFTPSWPMNAATATCLVCVVRAVEKSAPARSALIDGLERRIAELESHVDVLRVERDGANARAKALLDAKCEWAERARVAEERNDVLARERDALKARIETEHDRQWLATYNAAMPGLIVRYLWNPEDYANRATDHANEAHGERKKVT